MPRRHAPAIRAGRARHLSRVLADPCEQDLTPTSISALAKPRNRRRGRHRLATQGRLRLLAPRCGALFAATPTARKTSFCADRDRPAKLAIFQSDGDYHPDWPAGGVRMRFRRARDQSDRPLASLGSRPFPDPFGPLYEPDDLNLFLKNTPRAWRRLCTRFAICWCGRREAVGYATIVPPRLPFEPRVVAVELRLLSGQALSVHGSQYELDDLGHRHPRSAAARPLPLRSDIIAPRSTSSGAYRRAAMLHVRTHATRYRQRPRLIDLVQSSALAGVGTASSVDGRMSAGI